MNGGTVDDGVRAVLDEAGGLGRPAGEIGRTDDLFAAGLTSYATVRVMLALEEAFDVEMPDRMMSRATFSSIASLADAMQSLTVGSDA